MEIHKTVATERCELHSIGSEGQAKKNVNRGLDA